MGSVAWYIHYLKEQGFDSRVQPLCSNKTKSYTCMAYLCIQPSLVGSDSYIYITLELIGTTEWPDWPNYLSVLFCIYGRPWYFQTPLSCAFKMEKHTSYRSICRLIGCYIMFWLGKHIKCCLKGTLIFFSGYLTSFMVCCQFKDHAKIVVYYESIVTF